MIMSLVLFENEFLHIVSISFTALILNELIMVALEITTWYVPPFTSTGFCPHDPCAHDLSSSSCLGTCTWSSLRL
jgi:hypothetical protein